MTGIVNGDEITLDYTGTLETGEIFDSSQHGDHSHPLTFVVGGGMMIVGFDKAVLGMQKGEEKTFTVAPGEGYGMPDERMFREVPRKALPIEPEPAVGMTLQVQTPQGQAIPASIAAVGKETVTLDFNHPLAGKTLTFKIKVLEIKNSK